MPGGSGSGDSSSVIKGGGTDLTRTDRPAQGRRAAVRAQDRSTCKAADAELERIEELRLAALKSRLDAAIDANPTLRPYRNQIQVDITPEGLRIQIVDEQNRPMFDSGSALLKDYTREILREVGQGC